MFSGAVCRLCMQEHVSFLNIFDSSCNSADESTLPDMIFKSACVQVEENDGLSQFMCTLCKRELLRTINFIAMVERSDFTFRHVSETFQVTASNNMEAYRKNMTAVSEVKCVPEDHLIGKLKFKAALQKALKISEKGDNDELNDHGYALDADYYSSDDYYSDESMDNVDIRDNNDSTMFDESDDEGWTTETNAIVNHLIHKIEISENQISYENSVSHRGEKDPLQLTVHEATISNGNINVAFDAFESAFQELSNLVHIDEQMFEYDDTENLNSYYPNKIYTCHICGKNYRKEKAFDAHKMKHIQEEKKLYKCNLCQRRFTSPAAFGAHYVVHTSAVDTRKEKYRCNLCEKSFKNPAAFGAHIRDHTVSSKSISSLRIHQRVHETQTSTINSRKEKCDICECFFKNHVGLLAHRRVHDPPQRVECDSCGRIFKSVTSLKRHQNSHNPNVSAVRMRKRTCILCKRIFKNKRMLRLHLKKHNRPLKVYNCDSCSLTFNFISTLKRHQSLHNKM